jgi:hypothetical protein
VPEGNLHHQFSRRAICDQLIHTHKATIKRGVSVGNEGRLPRGRIANELARDIEIPDCSQVTDS